MVWLCTKVEHTSNVAGTELWWGWATTIVQQDHGHSVGGTQLQCGWHTAIVWLADSNKVQQEDRYSVGEAQL